MLKQTRAVADTSVVEAVALSIDGLLEQTVAKGASDLHLTVGAAPTIRVRGHLQEIDAPVFDPDSIRTLLYRILTTEQQKRLELDRQLDLSYGVPGLARFRINVFMQRNSLAAVLRVRTIHALPQPLDTLVDSLVGAPHALRDLQHLAIGLERLHP